MIKNGYRTYPSKDYAPYKAELHKGMKDLTPIQAEQPIKATLTLNLKKAVQTPRYRVKMLTTDNTSRIFDTKKEAMEYHNPDKHYIEYVEPVIKYGAIADVDNAVKPIIDYMEEIGIIVNDRYITDLRVKKTFNNKENSIEIELKELDTEVENGVYCFK